MQKRRRLPSFRGRAVDEITVGSSGSNTSASVPLKKTRTIALRLQPRQIALFLVPLVIFAHLWRSRTSGDDAGGLAVDYSVTPITLQGQHPYLRSMRFPSVEDRVRYAMSDFWYDPGWGDGARDVSSRNGGDGKSTERREPLLFDFVRPRDRVGPPDLILRPSARGSSFGGVGENITLASSIVVDAPLSADPAIVRDCARPPVQILRSGQTVVLPTDNDGRIERRINFYCEDVLDAMAVQERIGRGAGRRGGEKGERPTRRKWLGGGRSRRPRDRMWQNRRPLIVQLGDGRLVHQRISGRPSDVAVPVIHKWRYVDSRQNDPFPPILWPLEYERHFEASMNEVRTKDIPWEKKSNVAVWRGELTGIKESLSAAAPSSVSSLDKDRCMASARCRLCLDWISRLESIDVGIAATGVTKGDFRVDGVLLSRGRMEISDLLRYKMLISVEGNDVATNLKWALLSKSVVLMASPTKTSWAMEQMLEPWVHYVPLHANYTNLGEAVEWVQDHDEDAKKIAERATLFICDMLYHPNAKEDEKKVREEILRRYDSLFLEDGSLVDEQ